MDQYNQPQNTNDSGSIGWAVLGFFIPLVGLILSLVWKDSKPLSARKAGIGAAIGFGISVVFFIINTITASMMLSSM